MPADRSKIVQCETCDRSFQSSGFPHHRKACTRRNRELQEDLALLQKISREAVGSSGSASGLATAGDVPIDTPVLEGPAPTKNFESARAISLNPAIETDNIFGATDEDIYKCVMEARNLGEHNGLGDGDDVDIPEPVPTRREALQATFTLKRYLSTFNDPFARELEVMLGSFGQQTRSAERCRARQKPS